MNVVPGTTVDRYTFQSLLGSGGMAAVYLVRHDRLGSLHACKVLTVPSLAIQDRLLQEGRAQSALRHPNIVPVTDVITVGGAPGLIMEYVEGPTLRLFLRRHRLTVPQADHLARGILRGVAAAHRHGLVHRDLKPDNILLAITDEGLVPKVADFGLAKVLDPGAGGGNSRTRSGMPLGTPRYMAPEQVRDASQVDARADVWALGCILYELATGRLAFEATEVLQTWQDISEGNFIAPGEANPDLPPSMVEAIEGALQVDRERRLPSVDALLDRWTDGGRIPAPPPPVFEPQALELARALAVEEVGSVAPLKTGTPLVSGGSSETWADDAPGSLAPRVDETTALSDPRAVEAPEAPRRPRWPLAVLLVLAAVGGALLWLAPREPETTWLTAQAVPQVLAEPAAQVAFERGWEALLRVDLAEAERRLALASAAESPHPAPLLVYERVLDYDGRRAEALAVFWRAVERAGERPETDAALARAAGAVRRGAWAEQGEGLLAHLEAHPTDYLATLVTLAMVPSAEAELSERLLERLHALDPEAPLVWWLKGSRALAAHRFQEADEAAAQGLASDPTNPALLAIRGEALVHQGRHDEARALLEPAQARLGPRGRSWLVVALLHLGEAEAADRWNTYLLTDPAPLSQQARHAQVLSEALAGLGRIDEALAALEEVAGRTAEQARWTETLLLRGQKVLLLQGSDQLDATLAASEGLERIAREPEIPDGERELLVRNLLYAEGVRAARSGEVEEAERILARLRSLDRVWPVYRDYLEREIAITRQQPDRVAELRVGPDGECMADLEQAHALWRAGGGARVDPFLDRHHPDFDGCSRVGLARYLVAQALVLRGERALATGDPLAAREALRRWEQTWPEPDPHLPVVRRAQALKESLEP